jgi:hypothetical protein
LAIPAVDAAYVGIANPRGIRQDVFKHRLEVPRRAGDNAKHFRCRGLLLERFGEIVSALPQLIEQPRVLDGNDGLISKDRYQFNLPFGKRLNDSAQQANHADCHSVVEQRNTQHGAVFSETCRFALFVVGIGETIFNMDRAAREGRSPNQTIPINTDRISVEELDILHRRIV